MRKQQTRLLIPTLAIALVMLIGMAFVLYLEISLEAERSEHHQALMRQQVDNVLNYMEQDLQRLAEGLRGDWRIADALIMERRNALLDILQPMAENMEIDLLNVYDGNGRLVAMASEPHQFGRLDELAPEVQAQLRDEPAITHLHSFHGRPMLIYLTHMLPEEAGIEAVIAVGQQLDAARLMHHRGGGVEIAYLGKTKGAPSPVATAAHQGDGLRVELTHRYQSDGRYELVLRAPENLDDPETERFLVVFLIMLAIGGGTLYWAHTLTREAIQTLQTSQAHYDSLVAAIPGVVYQFLAQADGHWRFVYLNPRVRDLFEVGPEEAYADHNALTQSIVPEDRESHHASIRAATKTLSLWMHIYRIRPKSNNIKWIRAQATPQRQANGDVLWSGVLIDITDQKEAEQAVRLVASVFESAHESMLITDNHRNIVDVNEAFIRDTGYGRDEVCGRNPRFLRSGHQNRAFYQEMYHALEQEGHWSGELWNRTKEGEVYAALLTISAVTNDNGEVSHYVGTSTNITRLKKHQHKLEKIAHYDALTGLPNRFVLWDRMKQGIALSRRKHRLMAVCYLDLDGFKQVNDSMGHAAGDQVLIETSKRLGSLIRAEDTTARIGGDEFIVLLLELERAEHCRTTLARILEQIRAPIQINDTPVGVGASIGVSFYPDDAQDPDQLIRLADEAMYLAKKKGKNRFAFFSNGPEPH